MQFWPDDILILCIPPFDNFESFSHFLSLRLVSKRFNRILKSKRFWASFDKSRARKLCTLLSRHWNALKRLSCDNPLEEFERLNRFEKYSIPPPIKNCLIGEAKFSLSLIGKSIMKTELKKLSLRRNTLRSNIPMRERRFSKALHKCETEYADLEWALFITFNKLPPM